MDTNSAGRWIAALASMVVVVGLLVLGWTHRGTVQGATVGATAPDFRLATLDGDSTSLTDYRDRVVLLNFWATWCPPCIREMPAMERVHQDLEARGFTVLAVSVDALAGSTDAAGRPGGDEVSAGRAEVVRGFVEDLDLSFPILLDPHGRAEGNFDVAGLPTSYLIGRDGTIEARIVGAREWDSAEYRKRILDLLEE